MRRYAALAAALAACALAVGAALAPELAGGDQAAPLRRAVRLFEQAMATPRGFDNGVTQARVRDLAQARLAAVAQSGSPREAAQADDLIGVLAWGAAAAPAGVVAPGDRSVSLFAEAARLDPSDIDAKINLEIALRALAAHGSRAGAATGAGSRGSGSRGAGVGTPGRGY
jgi:hypothetical protein